MSVMEDGSFEWLNKILLHCRDWALHYLFGFLLSVLYFFLKPRKAIKMQLFDTKVAGDKVELKGEVVGAKLVLSQSLDLLPLCAPVLDKIKELIPGHFDDDLIEDAKKKLAAL